MSKIYTLTRIPDSWEYIIDQTKEVVTFELCEVGEHKRTTYMVYKESKTCREVLDMKSYRLRRVTIPTDVVLSDELLNYGDIFFSIADKGTFCIEDGTKYKGYTFHRRWNGWEMPMFTKEVAEQIYKEAKCECFDYSYNEEKDCFIEIDTEYPDEPSEMKGSMVKTVDGELKLYSVGNGWIWSEDK